MAKRDRLRQSIYSLYIYAEETCWLSACAGSNTKAELLIFLKLCFDETPVTRTFFYKQTKSKAFCCKRGLSLFARREHSQCNKTRRFCLKFSKKLVWDVYLLVKSHSMWTLRAANMPFERLSFKNTALGGQKPMFSLEN
jgi:hypothetical protein